MWSDSGRKTLGHGSKMRNEEFSTYRFLSQNELESVTVVKCHQWLPLFNYTSIGEEIMQKQVLA